MFVALRRAALVQLFGGTDEGFGAGSPLLLARRPPTTWRAGHEVTVIERHPAPAQGTSQSNAGLVSPGDATAWASPSALKTFLRAFYNHDLGIKVRLRFDPYFLAWSLRFLRQCTVARLRANKPGQAAPGALFPRLHQPRLRQHGHPL